MRQVLAVLGFIVGFSVAIGTEVFLVFLADVLADEHFIPRGLGFIVLPFVAGAGGARFAMQLPAMIESRIQSGMQPGGLLAELVRPTSPHARFMAVGAVSWIVAFPLYWIVFQPYVYQMQDRDWVRFFELLVIPVALFIAIYLGVLWARQPAAGR